MFCTSLHFLLLLVQLISFSSCASMTLYLLRSYLDHLRHLMRCYIILDRAMCFTSLSSYVFSSVCYFSTASEYSAFCFTVFLHLVMD